MSIDRVTVRRTIFEAPLMDERKWAKVPEIPADVFIADMEDSVPPDLKLEAREKVLALVRDPSYFGGREFICRPNSLSTPWGGEDLEGLAQARAPFILYPKVRTVEEMRELRAVLDRHGATPEIMLIVETPQAVLHLEEIASCPGVTALMFGPGDLSFETAFYPPHVTIINEVMTPSAEEIARARRVVEGYEEARERGLAAVTVDGRPVTVHEYRIAQRVLGVAQALDLA